MTSKLSDDGTTYSKSVTKSKKQMKAPAPPPPLLVQPNIATGSDSDQSLETNSVSAESQDFARSPNNIQKRSRKKGEWEILEGLKEGQRFEFVPHKFEGYLLKRRKWPLKGWHKRYFVLDASILTYGKNATELSKGKKHGSMDIGLSVVSTKASRRRIDIDADSSIMHVKCQSRELYLQWVEQLKQHRLHKQHQLLYSKTIPKLSTPTSPDESPTDPLIPSTINQNSSSLPGTLTRDVKHCLSSGISGGSLAGGGSLRAWILDTTALDVIGKNLNIVQQHLDQLSKLIGPLDDIAGEPATPSTKKRGKFRLRKNKSNKSAGSATDINVEKNVSKMPVDVVDSKISPSLQIEGNLADSRPLSSSNPALSPQTSGLGSSRPHSYSDALTQSVPSNSPSSLHDSNYPLLSQQPPAISLDARFIPSDQNYKEDFSKRSKLILSQMSCIHRSLHVERERAKQAIEAESNLLGSHGSTSMIATLRHSLNQALQQNAELRGRLTRIHEDSNLSEVIVPPTAEMLHKSLHTSLSYESSSCFSASEYFDAQDGGSDAGASDTSSEVSSDNSSFTSDASEAGTDAHPSVAEAEERNKCFTGRRTCLPVPKPHSEDFSLFNFLYKNIGKDLSKVSMPVSLNEPLNMLQRLCEELEYSELLDKASSLEEASERLIQVAAFAVSSLASSAYRAAHKPFNPLLGETFECIREDKGFRFVAEQVSHHPPISVCYAHSNNFIFWQDLRIKTKFWGRSMEFQPSGSVHVVLPLFDEHYEWNKVTCCVHNLFGSGQRWVDHYGEMIIKNQKENLTCKLLFVKANSWSSKRHEVFGTILNSDGVVLHNLFGKWSEALHCGHAPSARVVWRPGSLPDDCHLYYGFTRYAIELNEIDEDQAKYLPPTDTRFRPDQRLLEEAKIAEAEVIKQQLEQQQRDRRKKRDSDGNIHVPMWFRHEPESVDSWTFTGEYWNKRKDPGFVNMSFDQLW